MISENRDQKFRFPKIDPDPSPASKIEITPLESLSYIVNVACHKLEPDLKEVWDGIIGRDSSIPEISKNGTLLTSFDIKRLCNDFKSNKGKDDYVKKLRDLTTYKDMAKLTMSRKCI